MGKPTGFIEWKRHNDERRAISERTRDYREFSLPVLEAESRQQAGRCMDCGVPFCHQGCPLGNQIPDWNDLVYRDRWKQAFLNLASTNNFPEFTGRLCPAPCEASCTLAIDGDPVTIEHIEKDIIEHAFAHGWVVAQPPLTRSGKSVGVVGSGPAGLAAAAQLNKAGHIVTVYERDDRAGGLLRYGIPDFKMERSVVDRRLKLLEEEGVRFSLGVDVGGETTWASIRGRHDAVVIAVGARVARELEVPGRELEGVVPAMRFLERQNRLVSGDSVDPLSAKDRHVIILGGGDTGSDCLGTSHRQGAKSVHQVELFDAPPATRDAKNPWPQWPLTFRTSSSQEEGGVRDWGLRTTHLEGENGRVVRLHAEKVKLDGGKLVPTGETVVLPCDLLLLAMGFTGPEATPIKEQLGVTLDARGNVATDAHYATNVPGVFAAGDAHRGQSLIVWAIAEGREAARAVDTYLGHGATLLPERGQNLPFGGR